jgi:hypothetical protein
MRTAGEIIHANYSSPAPPPGLLIWEILSLTIFSYSSGDLCASSVGLRLIVGEAWWCARDTRSEGEDAGGEPANPTSFALKPSFFGDDRDRFEDEKPEPRVTISSKARRWSARSWSSLAVTTRSSSWAACNSKFVLSSSFSSKTLLGWLRRLSGRVGCGGGGDGASSSSSSCFMCAKAFLASSKVHRVKLASFTDAGGGPGGFFAGVVLEDTTGGRADISVLLLIICCMMTTTTALPYHDTRIDKDPVLKATVARLIREEQDLRPFTLPSSSSSISPPPPSISSSIKDDDKYSLTTPPTATNEDVATWRVAADLACARLEYEHMRQDNLVLALRHHDAKWSARIEMQELVLADLETQLKQLQAQTEQVNTERQQAHVRLGAQLDLAEEEWRTAAVNNLALRQVLAERREQKRVKI